ncbi:TDT family transporter [Methanobrevibacter millerae]|uniref:Exfoliative toxin A/B n=1 Tax=Methanobrevibacter millerae TaxID=230361 RepID=A0A1G5UVK2_9EURY|nr:TDT family transporter [Methanobrevibacter millerae]SDA37077.1 exfoliative toxin A/B [Methanobrevibacter millerae]
MNIIEKLPVPISGLILAILSLGNLLQGYPRLICGVVGVILMAMLLLRVIIYPRDVSHDLSNPIILSNSGTFSMALMILSTYINPFNADLALGVWILGVALHILLIVWFTYRFIICDFDIMTVYPSYWIVFIGITMGAITAHVHGLTEIAYLFFVFGFIMMLITLPLVVYRYVRYPNILDQNKPLICIFTAVMSILIVGYTNSFNALSYEFLMVLYTVAFVFFLFAFYKFIEYRNLDFYPSFSAFTFPFVITAVASKEVFAINQWSFFNVIIPIQTFIALVLVIYVFVRYFRFLLDAL